MDELKRRCHAVDLSVDTYSPGDGVRRYRFFFRQIPEPDYFAQSGIFTALSLKEAKTWLSGWEACRQHSL